MMHFRRPQHLVLALAFAFAAVTAACSGGTGASQPTPPASATADARAGWATPVTLPVTPVSMQFTVASTAFDPLPGARAYDGTNNGAGYQIEVPDNWNGEIVYFAHGFRGNGAALTMTPPPLREYLISRRYAWAASSFSRNGYVPGTGARDTYALRDVVARTIGQPKRSYIYGQSMGGNVVTVSLALYPNAYDGALTECGSLSGQGIVDYFLSWGALGGYFSDTSLTDITTDAGALATALRTRVSPALGGADSLTDRGRAFASAIENMTGGPRPYFREGFGANYLFNFALLVNAVAVPGASNAVAQNADTRYSVAAGLGIDSDALNSGISRVRANAVFQDPSQYPEYGVPDGTLAVPLLTLHGTGDLFVPISMEQIYARAVRAAGNGDRLVQRAIRRPGHCTFTQQERERAFDDLTQWVTTGIKPAGEDLLGDLSDAGRAFTNPLAADDPGGLTP